MHLADKPTRNTVHPWLRSRQWGPAPSLKGHGRSPPHGRGYEGSPLDGAEVCLLDGPGVPGKYAREPAHRRLPGLPPILQGLWID